MSRKGLILAEGSGTRINLTTDLPALLHHIRTDEVFGSLGITGRFCETTPYDPRSPYLASKAASAQLLQQLRPLAVPREADPGGDPEGCGGRADTAVWRWGQRARLALCGRPCRGLAPCGCPEESPMPG